MGDLLGSPRVVPLSFSVFLYYFFCLLPLVFLPCVVLSTIHFPPRADFPSRRSFAEVLIPKTSPKLVYMNFFEVRQEFEQRQNGSAVSNVSRKHSKRKRKTGALGAGAEEGRNSKIAQRMTGTIIPALMHRIPSELRS